MLKVTQVMEMNFDDLFYHEEGNALLALKAIRDANKEEELMVYLKSTFPNGIDASYLHEVLEEVGRVLKEGENNHAEN